LHPKPSNLTCVPNHKIKWDLLRVSAMMGSLRELAGDPLGEASSLKDPIIATKGRCRYHRGQFFLEWWERECSPERGQKWKYGHELHDVGIPLNVHMTHEALLVTVMERLISGCSIPS
jgi:hypothetical protein